MQRVKPYQSTVRCTTLTGVSGAASTDLLSKGTHGLLTGTPVVPKFASGFGGLTAGDRYYVIKIDADTFKLATSYANAKAGTAINISSDGSGMTLAVPTQLSPSAFYLSSLMLAPLSEGNSFQAYVGSRNTDAVADPRTPVIVANPALPYLTSYNLADLWILAHPDDGVDVFGFYPDRS